MTHFKTLGWTPFDLPKKQMTFLFKNIKSMLQDSQIIFLLVSLLGLLATRMATAQFSACDGIILSLLLLKINEFEEKGNDYV